MTMFAFGCDLFKLLTCNVQTYCMFQMAHQIHPHSHLGRHTHSLMADSVHWHTGTVLVHRSSENKFLGLHRYHPSSHLLHRSAKTQGCKTCFYTGTGFPGICGHLKKAA